MGLLIDGITEHLKEVCSFESVITELLQVLKEIKMATVSVDSDLKTALEKQIGQIERNLSAGKRAGSLSESNEIKLLSVIEILTEEKNLLQKEVPASAQDAFKLIKADYDNRVKNLKKLVANAGRKLENLFTFCEEVYADGQEMLILVTELTISYYGAHFISRYGCKKYFEHNKELLFYERQKEIIAKIENLDL